MCPIPRRRHKQQTNCAVESMYAYHSIIKITAIIISIIVLNGNIFCCRCSRPRCSPRCSHCWLRRQVGIAYYTSSAAAFLHCSLPSQATPGRALRISELTCASVSLMQEDPAIFFDCGVQPTAVTSKSLRRCRPSCLSPISFSLNVEFV